MKRVLSLVLLALFSTQTAFASIQATRWSGKPEMDNCTFFADYTDSLNGVDADFSVGSPQATFTRATSATACASYIDSSGVIQLVTTNNAPRYSQGYYDTTGFHAVAGGGLLMESSRTNDFGYSDGVANSGTQWTGWSILDGSSILTKSVVAIPELVGIAGATSQRILYNGNAITGGNVLLYASTKTAAGFLNGNTAVASAYVRSQTGISSTVNTVNFRFYWSDGNNKGNGPVQAAYSLKTLLATGSSSWKRIYTSAALADITKTITNIDSNGTIVTVTCSTAHGLANGSLVTISGTTNYNDANVTITTTGDTAVFTYPDPNTTDDAAETTGTVTNKVDHLSVQFYIDGIDTGETFDLEVAAPQIEKGTFPTSWIPTGANAAITRSADRLSYKTSGNRTNATESCFVKFMPLGGSFATDSTYRFLLSTDSKEVTLYKKDTQPIIYYYPNETDSTGTVAYASDSTLVNTSYVVSGISAGATASVNALIYRDGVAKTSDSDNYTEPVMGANFYVGVYYNGTHGLNGLVQKVAIFSDAKSAGDVALIGTVLG